jgi:hypothetical protein
MTVANFLSQTEGFGLADANGTWIRLARPQGWSVLASGEFAVADEIRVTLHGNSALHLGVVIEDRSYRVAGGQADVLARIASHPINRIDDPRAIGEENLSL